MWGSRAPQALTQWWRPIQTLSSSSLRWNLAMNLATAVCSSGLCREARWQPAWITLHQAWGGGNRLVRGGWGLPGQRGARDPPAGTPAYLCLPPGELLPEVPVAAPPEVQPALGALVGLHPCVAQGAW